MSDRSEKLTAIIGGVTSLVPPSFEGWDQLGAKAVLVQRIHTDLDHIFLADIKFHAHMRIDVTLTHELDGVDVTYAAHVPADVTGTVIDGKPVIFSYDLHAEDVYLAA